MTNLHAVVLAGGSGTRFWPAGRRLRPKQFLPLAHGRSLLRATIERVRPLCGMDRIWVATSRDLADAVRAELPDLRSDRLIVEPQPRDTAPCAALAAACIEAADRDAVIAMLPSDHLIAPEEHFRALLTRGAAIALDGRTLVTFGIRPTFAATGYGYVEPGDRMDSSEPPAHRVVRFREKPDRATAESFLAAGRMLWNSGMFVWTARALRAAMEATNPPLAAACATMCDAAVAGERIRLESAFGTAPKSSIDFAVMEHAPQVAVVEADLEWNDIGSFAALAAIARPDAQGNVRISSLGARSVTLDSNDCVIYGEGEGTIALLGVEGLVVARMGDVVLVCPKERAEEIKRLQDVLRAAGYEDLL